MDILRIEDYAPLNSDIFKRYKGYRPENLDDKVAEILENNSRIIAGEILMMTTTAGSGHPGGSLSSRDMIQAVYAFSNNTCATINDLRRDRVFVSPAHVAPALYALLGFEGYLDNSQYPLLRVMAFPSLRVFDSDLPGHVEKITPGVERGFGGLGQGLSAGVAEACACKLKNLNYTTFVLMSDGEQTKGQVEEARQAANKFNKQNRMGKLIGIIDRNHLQISGRTEEVMDVNIRGNYENNGWYVTEADGHDFKDLFRAIRECFQKERGIVIAESTMGKGVGFMENDEQWHGKVLPIEKCREALAELGVENRLEWYSRMRRGYELICLLKMK